MICWKACTASIVSKSHRYIIGLDGGQMPGLHQGVGVLAAVSHVQAGVHCAGQVNQVGVGNLMEQGNLS